MNPKTLPALLGTMQSPIVGFCEGDLVLFACVADAETYIEAVDVEDGAWTAFDAEGRLLQLETLQRGVTRVRRTAAESAPTHKDELRRKVKAFARRVGKLERVFDSRSLDELLAWAGQFGV